MSTSEIVGSTSTKEKPTTPTTTCDRQTISTLTIPSNQGGRKKPMQSLNKDNIE